MTQSLLVVLRFPAGIFTFLVDQSWRITVMRMSWLVCVLLGTLAWGQAAQGAPPAQSPNQPAPTDTSASVPADAPVLTITGVCAEKPAAASASADCKTIITKAEFEKLANALAPNASPQQKKQLASVLPRLMAMANQAKERGMDQTEQYSQTLEYVKMQVLSNQLQRKLQDEAADISDADIEKYYKDNPDAFEQFNLDRIFVPRTKQVETEATEDDDKDQKLTAEQKKSKEDAEKTTAQKNEEAMTKLADSLRARAAAGEDIAKLQKEAFDAGGMKIEAPTVNLPSVRRNGLPQPHTGVFDLKQGEVSQVISDAGGHYIYKMNGKSTMALDQAKNEIRGKIQNDRMREKMDKLNGSFSSVSNEAYFGPGGTGPMPPPRMPRPRLGTPAAGQPQNAPAAQPSAGQTPAPKKD
jgi:peptidyl-prolyl cis-trans isomerase C